MSNFGRGVKFTIFSSAYDVLVTLIIQQIDM